MEKKRSHLWKNNPLIYVFLILGLFLIVIPLYLTIITAFKTSGELLRDFFSFPESLYLGNF